ncbi:MAG: phosphoethanolamine transferase [Muribaculaceae bacterium]|nr:phosphoethanolamine transferase [Muribaculaceae bacterium]
MSKIKQLIKALRRLLKLMLPILATHRGLWLVSFVLSMLSVADVTLSPMFEMPQRLRYIVMISLGAFKASLITVAMGLLLRRKAFIKSIAWAGFVLYALVSIVNALSYCFYGFGVSRKLMVVISQTNPSEAAEFCSETIKNLPSLACNYLIWVGLVMSLLLYFLLSKMKRRAYLLLTNATTIVGAVFFVVWLFVGSYGRTSTFMTLRIPKYSYDVYKMNKEFSDLVNMRREFPDREMVTSMRRANNIIIVIGESASRNHHSIYGYPLKTTPRLDEYRDSLFVYSNALGSSTSTAFNMERILSFEEDNVDGGEWYKYPLLIDLFSIAGYKTYYLSNQFKTGLLADASGAIAQSADVINYAGVAAVEDWMNVNYDEVVLPPFREYVADDAENKLIITHLLGSHVKYTKRYPREYSIFGAEDVLRIKKGDKWLTKAKAQTIAEYDNSILHTDFILGEMLKAVYTLAAPTLFIYFSDHGECVYDDKDFVGRDENFVEVPFIIYANSAYRQNNADIVEQMEAALDYPISTANMIYALMSLSGTAYQLYYNEKKDFLSLGFAWQKRYVDGRAWAMDSEK